MAPLRAIYGLWDVWVLTWMVAAVWSARASARAPLWSQLWRDAVAFAGAALLFGFSAPDPASGRIELAPLWRTPAPAAWALVALTAASLGFCWWARLHIGRYWASAAGRKSEHKIIQTGPYGHVRHPIYTGLIGGLLAMAVLKGTPAALAGLALAGAGLWLRARLEERFLRGQLGEVYDAYSRRTPMLVPQPWRS